MSSQCTFPIVSALKKTALTVIAAALLPILTAVPASADTRTESPDKEPQPPASMSTVGGARLSKAGTQVNLGAGAPVLPKKLSGRSWIVADAESGEVLASHNAHWRLPPASTLKMLFADTLLPKLSKTRSYKVKPKDLEPVGAGSSLVGVKENLSYTVHDLWLGVFLRSGNDAVHVLAAMNGGVPKTVQDMQDHADELQALDTTVVSPDGYDEPKQVSSAYDLTLIARSGLQKKDFREYCATATAKFPGDLIKPENTEKPEKPEKGEKSEKPEKSKKVKPGREFFEIQNTNRLLTGAPGIAPYKGIAGVKNGNTTHAGATFTGVAERNGRVLLVTVMNPSSHEGQAVYQETTRLLDWGFAAAGKVKPVGTLVPPKSATTNASPTPTPVGAEAIKGIEQGKPLAAANSGSTGGVGTALAVTGGALIVLAGGVYLVNRRWPLPDLVRRRPRE
ncbi:D-alanyl-D-alanine carboxypeptidase family protein [Streptomyces sp. NPDC056672]|uniref:D-alanyl-D-alanine carboxypeptidase family protein n=1 Tax=Streptomyces sp. NPDC056672 TaxID=3345906 RepID=UPI0036BCA367